MNKQRHENRCYGRIVFEYFFKNTNNRKFAI